MKKFLFFAALAGVALTGCVNDENEAAQTGQKQRLVFDLPVMKTQTKANVNGEIAGVTYPTAENFHVFCKSYKGNFNGWNNSTEVADYFSSEGEVATADGITGYWSTETTHYWPEIEYNLAFAAYSPAEMTTAPTAISYTETGLAITGFQTETVTDNQYDLMYSARVVDRNKNNNANSAVPLVFNHALSSIVFSSQKSQEDIEYVITGVEVAGTFYQKGDFKQNIVETTGTDYSETSVPAWENMSEISSVTYTPTIEDFDVPTTPEEFTNGTSALLLIPQNVPADATVTINYNKTTNVGSNNEKTMSASATIKLSDFRTADNAEVTTWEIGKRYIYRIQFGQNTKIYFEPSVTDWTPGATMIYTIN